MRKYNKQISYGVGGCRAEVYTDDDDASGYGDNPKVGYWYGTLEACEAVKCENVVLYAISSNNDIDPFDLACERKWD